MNNNDIFLRLRYALNLKDAEVVEIFELGGFHVSKEDVQMMLSKTKREDTIETQYLDNDYQKSCNNKALEAFLDGLIIYKRGRGNTQPVRPQQPKLDDQNVNNMLLKKVKIALSLKSDDILHLMEKAGITLSNSELSAVLRKEGHRNYKTCGNRYARNFLKGLALTYRNQDR